MSLQNGHTKRLMALYDGTPFQHRSLNEPKYRKHIDDIVYVLDLPNTDLHQFDAIILPDRLHPEKMLENKPQIDEYLDRGGTVVAFGEQQVPLLPGVRWEFRPTNFWWWLEPEASSGLEIAKPDHSLFTYLSLDDCTWHQHGILIPEEKGVETLLTLEEGGTIMYLDTVTTRGTMLVTTLDPTYHYGSYFMPATERFLDGFLPWVRKELMQG